MNAANAMGMETGEDRAREARSALVSELQWLASIRPIGGGPASVREPVEDNQIAAIVATALLGLPSEAADEAITRSLAAVGLQCGAGRAFYYMVDDREGALLLTHEWHLPQMRSLRRVPQFSRMSLDVLPPPFLARLRQGGVICVPQTHQFLGGGVEQMVDADGDRALAIVPVVVAGALVGVAGFAAARGFEWRQSDLDLLGLVAQGIGRAAERRGLDHALEASEGRFRAMCDVSPLGIFLSGPRGDGRYLNPAGQRICGLSSEEMAGHGWINALHPDDRQRVVARWNSAVEAGEENKTPVHRFVHKNGEVCWVEMRAVPLVLQSGETGFLGILEDVTRRVLAEKERLELLAHTETARAEAEVARSEAEVARADVANILRRISDGFVALDLEGRYTYVNDRAVAMVDLPRDTVMGGVVWDLHPHLIGTAFHRAYLRAVRDQQAVTAEVVCKERGTLYEARIYPSPTGVSIFFEDISDRKQHEEQLTNDREYLRQELGGLEAFSEIVGLEAGLRGVVERISMVAGTNTNVLITGETGTGKELVARALHEGSPRRERLLVKVNCAAISAGLVESELFGHEKGAFTGAVQRRKGRFELAQGGTLFLDEIGELPLETQVKLLRVLQEREFERVGGSETVRVDVRVVAATNRDLAEMVANGKFREDLFYRLDVFPIALPPLRERTQDIPLLVHAFLRRFARQAGKRIEGVAADAMQRLVSYRWPGNVRELQNVIERAVILARHPVLRLEALPDLSENKSDAMAGAMTPRPEALTPATPRTIEEVERQYIQQALTEAKWVIEGENGAARRLGLHPNTLRSRLKRWGLARP